MSGEEITPAEIADAVAAWTGTLCPGSLRQKETGRM